MKTSLTKIGSWLMSRPRAATIVFSLSCALTGAFLLGISLRLLWLDGIEGIDVVALRTMVEVLAVFVFPSVAALLILCAFALVRRRSKVGEGVLVGIMCVLLVVSPGRAADDTPPPPPPLEEKVVTIAEAILGAAVVLIVGYSLVRVLLHWTNKLLPPTPPPKPPKFSTNTTSTASSLPLAGTLRGLSQAWDITAYATNGEWADPDGNFFTVFLTNQVECAADPSFSGNTERLTIHGWVSTNWLGVLLLDRAGNPVATNLSPRSLVPELESGQPAAPAQYFRNPPR